MRELACIRCQGSMEAGIVIDSTYGGTVQPTWVEGQPQRSIWTGLKLVGAVRMPITTYRCPRCGYLESYAAMAEEQGGRG